MKKSLAFAVAIFFTALPLGAPAAQGGSAAEQAAATAPRDGAPSSSRDIGADAAQAKQGVKTTAHDVKQGFKTGWHKVKRGLAVAQCNDGSYSYTHFKTCNHHGGVLQKFW